MTAFRLLRSKLERPLKFAIVGAMNTAIDIVLFTLLFYLCNIHIIIANSLSYGAGIVNSYYMNYNWTFADRKTKKESVKKIVKFIILNITSLILSTTLVYLFSIKVEEVLAKIASVIIVYGFNFFFFSRFVLKANP